MSKKIFCVVTNRASYTKLKSLLFLLNKKFNLQVVLAAGALLEKYGELESEIKKDGFKIIEKIYMLLDAQTLVNNSKSTGIGVVEFSDCFYRHKPSLVILMADRFEILSAAIAASYQNIKIAHLQGGENTGNIDQKVRYSVTALSDFHFTSTKFAFKNLKKFNDLKNVYFTGCPSIDLCKKVENNSRSKLAAIFKNYRGVGLPVNIMQNYLIIMYHPVTNEYKRISKNFQLFIDRINSIKIPKIWFWPNPDSGSHIISQKIRKLREKNKLPNTFFKNMKPDDFLLLLKFSSCIIGNSSAGIRESSYFGTPSINLGTRQLNRERGNNVINFENLNFSKKKFQNIIKSQINKNTKNKLYGEGNAASKIAKIIQNKILK